MSDAPHLSLCDLRPGDAASLAALTEGMDPALRHRLLALGFVPGTLVRCVRRAPLGDPTEFEVRGARVSLRQTESRLVGVARVSS